MFTTEISADTRRNTIQLLRRSKEILKALHEIIGMDFCKPYTIVRVDGPFTVNKLMKAAESANDLDHSVIAGLLYGGADCEPYLFTLSSGGNLTVDLRYHDCFDHFCTKGEFHKYRAYKENTTYLVIQNDAFIKTERTPYCSCADHADRNVRYVPTHPDGYLNYDSTMDVTMPHRGGKTARVAVPQFRAKADKKPLFDKNGYPLWIQRNEQESKLRQLKTERAANEVAKADFTSMIAQMETRISEVKALLCNVLEKACTSKEVSDIGFSIWHEYARAVDWYQNFREYAKNHTFGSVDRANDIYATVIKYCDKAEAHFSHPAAV